MDESLNETLQEETSRNRALALYEGTRGDDLVSEEIDERILKLLGLNDVFDIDYSTYMTLLREKMAEARMSDKKLSTDESMLIDEEYKRVKGKVGRFKLKKKKITADNLGVTGPIQVSKQQYYLTSKAIVPETSGDGENNGDLLKNVITINETVAKILESLNSQNKLIKKSDETERKRSEQEQRRKREEGLEKGLSKIASVASKMLAPVQGILDRILNFILYTLLGRAFVKFIDWFNNPKNKEKVEVLKRFLKDWWPTLLGALVLFTTPFGAFVRGFVGTVTKLTLQLARFAIPKLMSFVNSNPKTAVLLATGAATVGAGIYMQSQREERDKELQQVDPNYGKQPGPMKSIIDFATGGAMQYKGGGMIPVAKAFTGGGERDSLTPYVGDGFVTQNTGVTVTGAGADTQATVLQPGEVVFSKPAVDYWGADRLLAMNKMGGGTNIPKFVNNIQMAAGGGMIGKGFKSPSIQMGAPNIRMPLNIMSGSRQKRGMSSNIAFDFPSSPITDYPLSDAEKRAKMQLPVEKVFKRDEHQITPKGLIDFMTPSWSKTNSAPDSPYPHTSYDKEDFKSGVKYNPIFQDLIRIPYLDTTPREDIDYKMQYAPGDYDKYDPDYNTIQAKNITPTLRLSPPGPPVANSGKASIIELPPIIQQATQQAVSSGGTKVPQFMPPDTVTATINASIYGIG